MPRRAMTDHLSCTQTLAAVRAFHDKHDFRNGGGRELVCRVALMAEEPGALSARASKGKPVAEPAEACADLFILLPESAIAADFDLADTFGCRPGKLEQRRSRMVHGRIRVSGFRDT